MRSLYRLSVLGLLVACGRGSDQAAADTAKAFVEYRPSSIDTANARSRDSVMRVLEAYSERRVTADAAAKVVLDYVQPGRFLNAEFDTALREALSRDQRRRAGVH